MQSDSNYYTNGVTVLFFGDFPIDHIKIVAGDRRDMVSIPGLGISPGEGNGNPLQCSCLENPMNTGARQATVHRVTKSQT